MKILILSLLLAGSPKYMSFVVEVPPEEHAEQFCLKHIPAGIRCMDGHCFSHNTYRISLDSVFSYTEVENKLFDTHKFLSVNRRKELNPVEIKIIEVKRYFKNDFPILRYHVENQISTITNSLTHPFKRLFKKQPPLIDGMGNFDFEDPDDD